MLNQLNANHSEITQCIPRLRRILNFRTLPGRGYGRVAEAPDTGSRLHHLVLGLPVPGSHGSDRRTKERNGMNPDDGFERCLALLHEAALDDARWPAASALIDKVCGVGGNSLVVGERSGGEDRIHFARLLYRGEDRQDLARYYFEVHYSRDTGIRRLMDHPEGRLVHLPELYTEDELRTSPVYNEGWRRLGARNGLNVHFDDPDGLRLVWTITDPVGKRGWQRARLRLIERLLPHVRQFVRVRQALAAAGALGAGVARLLDSGRIGVVQLDRSGRILAANAPALEILRRGDALLDRDGVLDARLPVDRDRLDKLLARALPDWRGEAPSGGLMTVQRPSGRSRLALHVMPVGDPAADFGGRRVAALVLVVDPARRPRIDASRVAAMLGLTPSESRMAAQMTEGLRVQQIAGAEGWSEHYVRWLVKQVYRKLGISGQVALVQHVLAVDALPRR